MNRRTLICTVGTSLLSNLKFADDHEIKDALDQNNLPQLSLLLLQKNNTDRLCGAEINSITSICNHKFLSETERVIFLVSDTDDGEKVGKLLKLYYESTNNSLHFLTVEYRRLKGLRDDDIYSFRHKGLKNLVREISTEVRNFSAETIAINATGGYKAQISFAGMIGQALGIPVYYLFEKFSDVIELPPQPVSLDLEFWLEHYSTFEHLEVEGMIEKNNLDVSIKHEYWKHLLDQEKVDGTHYCSLSAMGILFHERSRLQFAKKETTILSLVPQDDTPSERKLIRLADNHHGHNILQAFAKKICCSLYVKAIVNSLPFNPREIDPIRRTTPDGKIDFVLTWTDQGLGLCIQTTGRNLIETRTIALNLKKEFVQ